MRHPARLLSLAIAAGSVLVARPAAGATASATVNASVVKPLELTRVQDLDLGTITLTPGSWSGVTVSLSRAGVRTCANPNLVCSGTARAAIYNVVGSNKGVVLIHAPNVTLVNQADPTKSLTLVTDAPASVTLPNSGQPGVNFSIGGSISLSGSTASGDYQGIFNVTAEYQ
jgi:hypothetical protein